MRFLFGITFTIELLTLGWNFLIQLASLTLVSLRGPAYSPLVRYIFFIDPLEVGKGTQVAHFFYVHLRNGQAKVFLSQIKTIEIVKFGVRVWF